MVVLKPSLRFHPLKVSEAQREGLELSRNAAAGVERLHVGQRGHHPVTHVLQRRALQPLRILRRRHRLNAGPQRLYLGPQNARRHLPLRGRPIGFVELTLEPFDGAVSCRYHFSVLGNDERQLPRLAASGRAEAIVGRREGLVLGADIR